MRIGWRFVKEASMDLHMWGTPSIIFVFERTRFGFVVVIGPANFAFTFER